MKWKNPDWFTSQRSAGKRRAPEIHLNVLSSTLGWTLAHGLMAMSHPSIHTPVVFSTRSETAQGNPPTESNIIKVVFGHEGTQRSPVTARNIRPNTQALVDWLHGCVPSWFHSALSQPYHTIVTGLLLVFWYPFNSASPANVTAALQDKSRIRAVCYKENSSVVEGLSKDSDVLTSLWWCCHYPHPRLSTAGAIVHLISRDAIFSHAGRASLLSPIVALAHLNLPDCGFHKKNSRSAAIFLMH